MLMKATLTSSYSRASTAILRAQSYVSGWIRELSRTSRYSDALLNHNKKDIAQLLRNMNKAATPRNKTVATFKR